MEKRTTFCEDCNKIVFFKTDYKDVIEKFHNNDCTYRKKIALCSECGKEVYVPDYEDYNLNALKDSYRIECDIITIEQLNELLKRYNIGKRPFSIVIGLGEITFTKYLEGKTPSKVNNSFLKEIYNNPNKYKCLLEQNKELISNIAYKKSLEAVNFYIKSCMNNEIHDSKLKIIAAYIISQTEDITQLMLQKMLYYVQALYRLYFNHFIFVEDCEAWVHGPVYRIIYDKYKDYHYDSISDDIVIKPNITTDEKMISDLVIKYFGCYSGRILEQFTHSETPWLKTREGLFESERSDKIISKKLIEEYFLTNIGDDKNLFINNVEQYSKRQFYRIIGE